ncbi:lipase family protein [Crossiella sp. CA-258035]|uniref:lipase family protein n=1 Tax=Crossiella sp. CA-258035 TaxID=2981138 RepID=UPI0024BC7F76|nr:lipase family protein [Crossiella sp. CA-258035]WHT22008.1 lipase family protein [Crossiella sp. CA-258035]
MSSSSRRRALLITLFTTVLTLAATVTAIPATAATAGIPVPSADPFYRPPAPLPPVAAGDVLRSRPITAKALVLPFPVRAWQVLHRSTNNQGKPNAVVATVLVPHSPWTNGPRPLVAYNIGTHGLSSNCAPSFWFRAGIEYELALMTMALLKGWAVVVSDYEGSATTGPHTYTAGRPTGHAVLDGIRAAQRLPEAGLDPKGPVGIWGYSEGGLATSWAAELQPGYAPELNVRGAAAGGVPRDIGNVGYKIDGGPFFGFFLAAAIGLDHSHPEMQLESVLNAKGRKAFAEVRDMCHAQWTPPYAFHRISEFTEVPDPIQLPQFQKVLERNRLGTGTPAVPAYVYQSVNDEFMPINDAKQLVRGWCSRGVRVQLRESLLSEHISLAVTGAPGAVSWLADRFANQPAPSNC